uniref:RING-type E3 ubiquitin transferase n=1 Tax=Anopheles merus TaxID=30066 RepID=A0A182UZT1_ANOME
MEALVENAAAPPSRFYCHSCAIEIDRVSSAIRLAGEIFTNSILSPFFRRNDGESAGAAGTGNGDHALFTVDDIPMDGSSGPSSGASGTGTDMGEGSAGGGGGSSSSSGSGGGGAGAAAAGGGDTRPSVRFTGRRGSRRRGVQNINHVDQILREILISVSGGGNGAGASGPMFFMGNPGDYAWGREGIDTIVTQLLNQMDNSGPPPLEKERIAAIPTVTISEEQVERKLQCSVCFEDFVVGESVRKLPCLHVYHEPCIIPWLELHGTCPICRNSLSPEESHTGAQPQDSSQSPTENSQQSAQQQTASQSDPSGRQNSNFLTFTIRPTMTNLLFDMGPPLTATSVPFSSPSPSSASGSGSAAGTGNSQPAAGSNASASGSAGGSAVSGGGNGSQASNSQRDEDGTIDNTLELD